MNHSSRYRSTYPDTQRREITFWDVCLAAGIILFVVLGSFLLQSVACFHKSETCFLGSAELGEMILNWIK